MARYTQKEKRDQNEREIIKAFDDLDWAVAQNFTKNMPDLICSKKFSDYLSFTILVEVKGPNGKLRQNQQAFIDCWAGDVFVVRSIEDVIEVDDYFLKLNRRLVGGE